MPLRLTSSAYAQEEECGQVVNCIFRRSIRALRQCFNLETCAPHFHTMPLRLTNNEILHNY